MNSIDDLIELLTKRAFHSAKEAQKHDKHFFDLLKKRDFDESTQENLKFCRLTIEAATYFEILEEVEKLKINMEKNNESK